MNYSNNLKLITQANFHEEILSEKNKNVLLYFSAQWCGPCKMIKPVIENIARDYSENLFIGHVDIDQDRHIAGEYSIYSIPSFLYFKDNELIHRHNGFRGKEEISKTFNI